MRFKRILFLGDALERLRDFPEDARRQAGYELYKVQQGRDPGDWRPMASIGAGVREIRVRDEGGAYRVIYVATLPEAVYVLHAFQKMSRKTARRDLELAGKRHRELRRG